MSMKMVGRFEILDCSYPVLNGMNIIGRDLEASIIIKNLKISKKHAIISVIEDKHYITDFKSSNGCSLNDEELIPFKFYEIYDGTNITLGDLVGIYYIESTSKNAPSNSAQEVQFLKPKVPKHINIAPTQQLLEVPKINITHDDSHMAPTQLIVHENNESTNITGENSKVFSLLGNNDKTNVSKEIILCDDSLNDNLDDSFAKVALENSVEVACTQECFSRPKHDSFNDSSIIPSTQDVSCDRIHQRSSELKPPKGTTESQDCQTQMNDPDSDATDTEINEDLPEGDICISVRKFTPEPFEGRLSTGENKDEHGLSDDEEIDFCDTSAIGLNSEENITHPEEKLLSTSDLTKVQINTTTASSCLNELDQNINEEDLQTSSVKNITFESESNMNESEEADSIPETEEFDVDVAADKSNENLDIIPATQDEEREIGKFSSRYKVDFMAPTQIVPNERGNHLDVDFDAPTQIMKQDKSNKHENKDDDKYLAPCILFDVSAHENIDNSDFKEPIKKRKKNNRNEPNEYLDEADDINFLASTQEMMNNSENSETQSHHLDYYSSQEIDGIPEITSFESNMDVANEDVFMAPTQVLQNNEHEKATKQLNKIDSVADNIPQNVDYSAPTQVLQNIDNIVKIKTDSTKKEINFSAPTQILDKNNFDDGDNAYFLAPTQTFLSSKQSELNKTDDDLFLAPTQQLNQISKDVMSKNSSLENKGTTKTIKNKQLRPITTPASNAQLALAQDDEIFLAPTQVLIDASINQLSANKIVKEIKDTIENYDSDDSDIEIKKKRPKMITETQEIVIEDSDSSSDVEYKHKKPVPILETQEVKENLPTVNETEESSKQTLSDIIKSCANDSAVELDDTEESIHLVLSNSSINVSRKSLNTSNIQDGESQLEVNLPTEKEYFVSQNTRPANPLAQIFSSEKNNLESKTKNERNTAGSSTVLHMFSNLLNNALEPTQVINDDELETSLIDVSDSDPDDYGEICEMETQPITDKPIKKTNAKTKQVKKVEEIKIPEKRGRKRKETSDALVESTVTSTRSRANQNVRKKNVTENEAGSSNSKKITKNKPITTEDTPIEKQNIVSTRGKRKVQTSDQKELPTNTKENKLNDLSSENSIEKEISTRGKRQVKSLKQIELTKKTVDNIVTENEADKEKPSTSKRNSKKRDQTNEERVEAKKRSTRGKPVSKEETASISASTSTAKRRTRADSVTKEESHINIDVKTRRKTLASVTENLPSKGHNHLVLRLTPIELKNTNKTSKIEDVVEIEDSSEDEFFNEKTKTTRNAKSSKTEHEKTNKNINITRRKTMSKEIVEKANIESVQQKDETSKPKTGQRNTKNKTITKSDSGPNDDETPIKKLKENSQENLLELDPSGASTNSTPRRQTRLRHKVVFTMLDDPNIEATISRLGGTIVNSSQECTVLVTSKISRSLKFLVAVSLGKPICGPEWVTACSRAHKFLDPWEYILKDTETETKNNFKLRDAIIKGSDTKMLEGFTCLLLVSKNLDVLKNVIDASGGICVTRAPTKNSETNFIVISYPEDKNKYTKFLKQKPPVMVVSAEAIFSGALRQDLVFEGHLLK